MQHRGVLETTAREGTFADDDASVWVSSSSVGVVRFTQLDAATGAVRSKLERRGVSPRPWVRVGALAEVGMMDGSSIFARADGAALELGVAEAGGRCALYAYDVDESHFDGEPLGLFRERAGGDPRTAEVASAGARVEAHRKPGLLADFVKGATR